MEILGTVDYEFTTCTYLDQTRQGNNKHIIWKNYHNNEASNLDGV